MAYAFKARNNFRLLEPRTKEHLATESGAFGGVESTFPPCKQRTYQSLTQKSKNWIFKSYHFVQNCSRRTLLWCVADRWLCTDKRGEKNDRLGYEQRAQISHSWRSPATPFPTRTLFSHFISRASASLLKAKGGNGCKKQKRPHYSVHKKLWRFRFTTYCWTRSHHSITNVHIKQVKALRITFLTDI